MIYILYIIYYPFNIDTFYAGTCNFVYTWYILVVDNNSQPVDNLSTGYPQSVESAFNKDLINFLKVRFKKDNKSI